MNNYRRRRWHPTPVLLPGKSHGWRSLVGCHLWGHTESDTTEETEQQQHEQLHTSKSDNLEEMDQLLESNNLPRLNHEDTENLNRTVTNKETEWVIKKLPTHKIPR